MATLQTLLSQQMIERLGWTLIHFVWQATAVALMLAVVLRCLRRSSSNTRYIVSCLAMVLIVALTLVTMSLVEVSRPVAEAGPTLGTLPMSVTPVEVIELAQLRIESFDAPVPAMPERAIRVPWTQRAANALEPALPWLVSGWLLGVFGLSAWHLGGWAQLQRMKRRMVRQVAEPLHASLADLSNRLGVRHAVGLLESALVEVPTVVGWLKPVILLPASALSGLTTEQLEAILAHELAHVRRCDYLVNLAQTVVEILGFYHPAVWWISHRIRDERENCCDDVAVGVCGDSRRYARALTCLEELRHHSTELAVAASGGSLVARIARLLGRPPIDNRRFAWLPGLIALLVVAAILIPTALVLAGPEAPMSVDRVESEPNVREFADEPPAIEATTQPADGEQADPIQILFRFKVFPRAVPDKVLDHETSRLVGEILAAEIPQALDQITARQNITVAEVLRTWVAGRLLTPDTLDVLVDILQSRGYLDGEATPELLAINNQQAEITIGTVEPSRDPADPTTFKLIEFGTTVRLTPHASSPTSDRMTIEIGIEWKDRVAQAQPAGNPTIRSTEIASTVTVRRGDYFTLLAEPEDKGNAETATGEFHLVMLRADLFEPDLTLPQTVPPSEPAAIHTPVPSPPPVATVEPSADETDRQVLLSFTIAEVPSREILDRETAILVRTLLATEARENYTAPRLVQLRQPLWRVFREHLADPNLSGDTIKAVLDVLISNGYGQILSTPKLLTTNRRWARIILGNAPSRNASATSDRDRSFGMNLDVTPTIRHAQDIISLGLDITFRDAFLALDDKTRTQRDESLPKRHRIEESRLSLFRIDTPNERYAFVSLASAAERLDAQGDFHLPVLLVKPTLIEPPAAPALAPSASEQATADAAREFEFVRTDPVVQMLMQRITEVEIELLEAQQTFLPEHPEIVQKKQLLEALNTHLEKRHRWLEQEFQAGRTSVAAPDDPAQQRANAETVLAILRQDLARVDEEIDKADSAWYPDEAERSRELKNLKQHKEVIEGQAQEIARIIEEQFGPPAEPEPYQLSETDRSAERMRHLGLALRLYADSHDGRYPDDLLPLDPYLSLEDSRWIETSVVYSGKGRTANDESDTPIAYDRSVLEKTGSTLSVFADGQIRSIPVEALTPPHRKTNAVEMEARFVLVDRECMEAMQRGLPIKGVAAPADVNALHEIGADIVEGRTPVLEPDEVELLLKAVRQYTASKMLATPRVIVADAESASIRIGGPMDYISGYREPDGASHQPIPQNASKETGVRFDVTPYLIEDPNSIRLQFDMEITSLLATQKALYQGKYEYDIPTFTTVTVDTEIVIPNGQTALIHAGSIRSLGGIGRDEGDPPAPMLMLIKPTIAAVPPPAPAPPMPDKRRPGDPGMGGLPPGTNLW